MFFTIEWNKLNQSTGVPSLTSHVIEHQKIFIPKLDEQKKIAMFFTIIDKKIDVINSKIDILKKYKEGIVNLCFFKGKNISYYLLFIKLIDEINIMKILMFTLFQIKKDLLVKKNNLMVMKLHQ